MIPDSLKKMLEKQQYAFIGRHSAIKICHWTKKSLLDEGVCYKQKFYGIQSHRCCQMSPSIGFCPNRCIFCWRPVEYTVGVAPTAEVDDPKELIKNAVLMQRRQLVGFKGNPKTNMKKFTEAMEPMHFAISLAGEPTAYPRLKELIEELHKLGKTTFVVSNGMFPERLAEINPTQLYVSISAPNELLFNEIAQPQLKKGWNLLIKSLGVLKRKREETRTTLRITLIKERNMVEADNYARLIELADPIFVEVKAYMHVGFSSYRLSPENMPSHNEVRDFAEKIAGFCNRKIVDESGPSRVVLLMKEEDFERRFICFKDGSPGL